MLMDWEGFERVVVVICFNLPEFACVLTKLIMQLFFKLIIAQLANIIQYKQRTQRVIFSFFRFVGIMYKLGSL